MTVRIATKKDGAAIADIYAPIVENTSISFEDIAPSADEMSARIDQTLETHPWLVIAEESRVTAYAYATQHRSRSAYRWSCDVSVYVSEGARRTGAARQLYTQLFAILIHLGYRTAFAGITLPNEASIGFHINMGFEIIGVYPNVGFKQGVWRDVSWWSRPLQTFDCNPSEPLPFSDHQNAFQPISA